MSNSAFDCDAVPDFTVHSRYIVIEFWSTLIIILPSMLSGQVRFLKQLFTIFLCTYKFLHINQNNVKGDEIREPFTIVAWFGEEIKLFSFNAKFKILYKIVDVLILRYKYR